MIKGFRLDNGKSGIEHIHHTATGYECPANYPGNDNAPSPRISLFLRHVVGGDGRPYTEAGLSGLVGHEQEQALGIIKDKLVCSGIREVDCITEVDENLIFSEYQVPAPDSVAVRVRAGTSGIMTLSEILSNLIHEEPRTFIKEQETLGPPDEILFESLMQILGPEMSKGPGDEKRVVSTVKKLAREFLYGYESKPAKKSAIGS